MPRKDRAPLFAPWSHHLKATPQVSTYCPRQALRRSWYNKAPLHLALLWEASCAGILPTYPVVLGIARQELHRAVVEVELHGRQGPIGEIPMRVGPGVMEDGIPEAPELAWQTPQHQGTTYPADPLRSPALLGLFQVPAIGAHAPIDAGSCCPRPWGEEKPG